MEIGQALTLIREVPNFPSQGILFQDITPLLSQPEAFTSVTQALSDLDRSANIVAGIEARGFILGSAIALLRGNGFVPVRKKGKLPHRTISRAYGLEYGSDEIEIHQDAFEPTSNVLVVDDVLATGGTLEATLALITSTGAHISSVVVLLEIEALEGRHRIKQSFPDVVIHSLVLA
jgi:adenine phosphoribosyltransferase